MEKPAPDPTGVAADAADGGWTSESHSAPEAVADAAVDTTADKTPVETATVDTDTDTEPGPDAQADAGHTESAGLDATAAQKAAKAAKPKKGTVERREAALTKQIDTLTHTRAQTAKEVEDNQRELVRLKAERTTLEAEIAAKKPPVPGAPPVAAARQPADGAMPVRPKMADYDDYVKFDEDLGRWETEVRNWQATREQALKKEITDGVDTRLTEADQQRARAAHDERLATNLRAGKAAHPDWDEKVVALKDLRSAWHDPAKHGAAATPFLSDVTQHSDDPAELLYWSATVATEDPERAQRLADLYPTQPLRDAVVMSSSPLALLDHFSTEEGFAEFERLKGMHPVRLLQAVGALSARLSVAPSGPTGGAPAPITQATPSAKPPAGTPRARDAAASPDAKFDFNKWMADEDAKEAAARKSATG